MNLTIVTPEKTIFSGATDAVTLPTVKGEITVLPKHVNLLTQMSPGEVRITTGDKTHYLGITGGFLEVSNDTVTILADYAVRSEEIEVEKALAAQKRAEELLKKREEGISERDLALAASELRRSIMEIHVGTKRRHRTRTS